MRYFGGRKLGTGGLIRAYSMIVSRALDEAKVIEVKARCQLGISVPFRDMDTCFRFLDRFEGLERVGQSYIEEGVSLVVSLLVEDKLRFERELLELTSGRARINI